ncbi:DP-Gal:betaGlcNAc beta 1,4- galactosyltransferase, polypeptide 1, like [Anabas testudineus]|uniref:Beta-1,4-galactosyltransferase n=1 Tax=Anabas testudineus TaxID=64144 RepID=A0AAQ6IN11_ANATE|nr:DP-Gal:betaGlcNAc beta 1,4- galactosyltransferase, polypeptide 1, like [Anabas testudineus]
MPGDSPVNFNILHRTCKLVVLLCLLHISVTVVFYVRSLDVRFAFAQNQQSQDHVTPPDFPRNPELKARKEAPAEGPPEPKDEPKPPEPKDEPKPPEPKDEPKPPEPQPEQKETEPQVTKLEKCPDTSPVLVGPLRVEFDAPVNLEQIKKENPGVQPGGRFKPKDCEALQKVAIIIPFRKRDEHLKYWLYYLHPILQRQQLDYGVYVINQDGDEIFNRAKLLNVGFEEALKEYDYNCFVFSDVDLIPMDDRNTYKCYSQPRHLSVSMDKFGFRLPYYQYFGGVSSLSKEQYLKINGFPNNYWGWGGEDDDIYNRLVSKGMSISRPSGVVGKCRMIRHERDKQNEPNPQRFDRIAHTRETMHKDGINSLSYQVVKIDKHDLFTKITVDVGKP